ncbi:MAG: metallopeptidase family protein [Candidatus Caldatribacteriaceae bacterium]
MEKFLVKSFAFLFTLLLGYYNGNMDKGELTLFIYEVIEELPGELREKLHNVEFIVEDFPAPEVKKEVREGTILALYRGVPLAKRGRGYNLVLPDQIIVYAGNIEKIISSSFDWKGTVRKVVLHEIGHYFGFGEEELRELLGL